jgi:hypothetical protein
VATWDEMAREAPALATASRGFLDARRHKTLATLRRDGSPRISGIEAFFLDGDLWFGSMWRAVKALDLRRDARFALHSGSIDPPDWPGDAKVAGRVEEITDPDRALALIRAGAGGDPPGRSHLFRADVTEVSTVRLGDPPDHLVIESWREGRGLRRLERT